MTILFDANVLVALAIPDHVHHGPAEAWFSDAEPEFATCPITQASLVRLLVRHGRPAATAQQVITQLADDPRHEFWPDSLTFAEIRLAGVIGHRQVTDAYLAQLARAHSGRLATFDQGLAELHSDVAQLVPVQ